MTARWRLSAKAARCWAYFPTRVIPDGIAQLRPDDCLVLFTDGITEAMNAKDEEFGEERLMALLNQTLRQRRRIPEADRGGGDALLKWRPSMTMRLCWL